MPFFFAALLININIVININGYRTIIHQHIDDHMRRINVTWYAAQCENIAFLLSLRSVLSSRVELRTYLKKNTRKIQI